MSIVEDEERELRYRIVKEVDDLLERNNIEYEHFLEILGREAEAQAKEEMHEGVTACLMGAAQALYTASFNIYASTK